MATLIYGEEEKISQTYQSGDLHCSTMSSVTVSAPPPQDSFGDLLGTMGMPPPVQPAATNGETNTDDKDKGLPCK